MQCSTPGVPPYDCDTSSRSTWPLPGISMACRGGGGAYDKGKVFPKSRCVTLCRPISFRGRGQKAATPESSSLMEGWVGSKFASGKMSHKEKHYDRAENSNSMGVLAERPPVRTSTSLDQWRGITNRPMCPCAHVAMYVTGIHAPFTFEPTGECGLLSTNVTRMVAEVKAMHLHCPLTKHLQSYHQPAPPNTPWASLGVR